MDKYVVKLMPRFVGDIEYCQRKNWNSPKKAVRERANLMFSRMRNELYELSQGNEVNLTHIGGSDYKYTFTDKFATLRIKVLIDSQGVKYYFVEEVIWHYKTIDWWNIIEAKRSNKSVITESQLRRIIRETLLKAFYD